MTLQRLIGLLILGPLLSVAFSAQPGQGGNPVFEVRSIDRIACYNDEGPLIHFGVACWSKDWKFLHPRDLLARVGKENDLDLIEFTGRYDIPQRNLNEEIIPFSFELKRGSPYRVDLRLSVKYAFLARGSRAALVLKLPTRVWAGKTIIMMSGEKGQRNSLTLPLFPGRETLMQTKTTLIHMQKEEREEGLRLVSDRPLSVEILDRRAQSLKEKIEIRLWLDTSNGPVGGNAVLNLSLMLPPRTMISMDPKAQGRALQTKAWLANPLPRNSFPVDLSFLNHRPAGSKGFLTVKGDRFVFESGEEARFWGVNLSADQCFPEKIEAEALAKRLASLGVNLVRFHHLDVKWGKYQLFHLDDKEVLHFDPIAWLRLDYLIYRLKEEGIYIQFDMLVDPDHIWPKPPGLVTWKGFTHFVPKLIQWQKQYTHAVWGHNNPYTGLAYKDDPVFVLTTITNENDLTTHNRISRGGRYDVEPYISQFETILRQLILKNSPSGSAQGRNDVYFLSRLQASYFEEMRAYMRQVGVRIPITGTNWCFSQKDLPSLATMDYLDTHAYGEGRLDRRPSLGSAPSAAAFARVSGKPFVVSEYGALWPDRYRFTLPIWFASIGCLQGWNGLILYAYGQRLAKGIDQLKGAYNLGTDPMTMGVFPVSALIFRRGDVQIAKRCKGLQWTPDMLFGEKRWMAGFVPFYNTGAERHKLVAGIGSPPGDIDEMCEANTSFHPWEISALGSDSGELVRDFAEGTFSVNSERTKGVVGRFTNQRKVSLGTVQIEIKSGPAAVFLSSLDGEALERSRKILITAVGQAENTGAVWNLGLEFLLDEGRAPVRMEPVEAVIRIKHEKPNGLRAVAIRTGKQVIKRVQRDRDGISIALTGSDQAIFYLLTD